MQRRVHDRVQGSPLRSVPGHDRQPLHDGDDEIGQRDGTGVGLQQPVGSIALDPRDEKIAQIAAIAGHRLADVGRRRRAGGGGTGEETAGRRVIACENDDGPFQDRPRGVEGTGRRIDGRSDCVHITCVKPRRFEEEPPFIAERGVKAGRGDPHRLGEIADRRRLVTMGPEGEHGFFERDATVERERASGLATGLGRRGSKMFHSIHYGSL